MLQMTKVKDSDSVGEGEVSEEVLHYCRDFKIFSQDDSQL